jgi:hypothetical protein
MSPLKKEGKKGATFLNALKKNKRVTGDDVFRKSNCSKNSSHLKSGSRFQTTKSFL